MAETPLDEHYHELETKFKLACTQLKILNSKVADIQVRYDRANAVNRRSYRYTLRIRLVTLEGVRNMFYEYAMLQADKLDAMRLMMQDLEDEVIVDTSDSDDSDDDDEAEEDTRGNQEVVMEF